MFALLCAAPIAVTAAPSPAQPAQPAQLAPLDTPALAPITTLLAQATATVESWMPCGLAGRIVAFEHDLRDLAHGAESRLVAWTHELPGFPDVAVLTTAPILDEESSGFGWRDDPIHHDRRFHYGADIHADPGTPVLAAGAGVVVFAGRQGGYGNVIYVDHGGGVVTRYAHLRRIETRIDAAVTAGERIGQVGSTGRSTGPHLHFEVRLDGRAVDPETALTVAELERESPETGRLAAFALAPELMARHRDTSDEHRRRASRPERAGRAARAQVLW